MADGIIPIFGGLGLFLLGMTVMTEGLRDLAGNSLRQALARFTKTPLSGAATGTISTALIQSSSATTVMAVGFVGAGLLTFPQALGILFGANVGTTITGWLVALLGFKFSLQNIVLPLIFVGALMRLFGRRQISAIGYAVAGFGLVFAGISMLQDGMEGYRDVITPDRFPPNTIPGRLLLVLIGAAITLVTQSSSAGVATAITAVHVGNITLAQAAALVIGMDVGTTVTAAFATIGGNTDARRTGMAHVIYNVLTGIGAFMLLPFCIGGWEAWAPDAARSDPEIALVTFHTFFNTLGLVVVLPFTNQFAWLIMRLIPTRGSSITSRLDSSFLVEPNVAIDNARATLMDLTQLVFRSLAATLHDEPDASNVPSCLAEAERAVKETRTYLSQLGPSSLESKVYHRYLAAIHVLDHLNRLIDRCRSHQHAPSTSGRDELLENRHKLWQVVSNELASSQDMIALETQLEQLWLAIDARNKPFRREVMALTATGELTIDAALEQLDTSRGLRRLCYHAWRIIHHLSDTPQEDGKDDFEPEPAND